MRALRSVSSEKGRDPREFALVAYGGSGPVHAAGLAAELGVRTVVVPPLAGLFSAAGLLFARTEFHDVRFCHVAADASGRRDAARARGRDARGAERRDGQRGRVAAHAPTSATPGRTGTSRSTSRARRSTPSRWRRSPRASRPSTSASTAFATRRARRSRSARSASGCSGRNARAPDCTSRRSRRRGATRLADFGEAHGAIETPVVSRDEIGAEPSAGPAADRRVRHDRRRPARLDGAARRGRRAHAHGGRRRADAARRRPRRRDRPGDRRQRVRVDRRRDGDDDLPHRALDGRARRHGLLGRALRPDRRDGGAGGHDPAAPRLDPDRDALAARALRRRPAPRRRVRDERPVRRRHAHARHLRRQAGLPRRGAHRLRGDGRAPRRRGRPAARARAHATTSTSSRRACGCRGSGSAATAGRSTT